MTDFKPRWIRWDEDAFRADRQVNRMTPRQRAMCRNLMIEAYYNEFRPYLPGDDARLWQLADADGLEDWLQNKAAVLAKFKPVTGEDDEPLLANKRVMEEWSALQASLEQKRSAAAKSVAARRQLVRERENLPHTPSENKNQKENKKENKSVERPLNERSTDVREEQAAPAPPSIGTSSTNVVAKWMEIYEGQYGRLGDAGMQGYKLGLEDLKRPELLDRAFLRAMRGAPKWRPSVAQIREAYEAEAILAQPRKLTPEPPPPERTPEEQAKIEADCAASRQKFLAAIGDVAKQKAMAA